MMKNPVVSVVLSAYNAEKFINISIASILSQTLTDYELIIINDGSTDSTLSIIKGLASKDSRIRYVSRDNRGLVDSLNEAIGLASTEIIVRHDVDDLSLPNRLEKQYDYLMQNPEVILVGSSINTVDENYNYLNTHKVLIGNNELKLELMVRSPFAHGSVMFRKNAFIKAGRYRKAEWPAEDYGLWVRMAKYGCFANIDEPLYEYMENSSGISQTNEKRQEDKKKEIQKAAWNNHGSLLKSPFDTTAYRNLEMGEYRIERICNNLYFTILRSLRTFNLIYLIRLILLLVTDKILFRKTVRLALIKLKLKHV